jgi:hypothetical protein
LQSAYQVDLYLQHYKHKHQPNPVDFSSLSAKIVSKLDQGTEQYDSLYQHIDAVNAIMES